MPVVKVGGEIQQTRIAFENGHRCTIGFAVYDGGQLSIGIDLLVPRTTVLPSRIHGVIFVGDALWVISVCSSSWMLTEADLPKFLGGNNQLVRIRPWRTVYIDAWHRHSAGWRECGKTRFPSVGAHGVEVVVKK